jgi:aspartate--ammonia ligase
LVCLIKELYIPKDYTPLLSVRETEKAIKFVKDTFENELAAALNLERISAPLFVRPESGLNDNLNGIERPVRFDILSINADVEIVQSLAKWKRLALREYKYSVGEGIYTDMNAIRRDETLDNIHSVYVDQWDWEKIIDKDERNMETLKSIVISIYNTLYKVEGMVNERYLQIKRILPERIFFITSQELEDLYPKLSPKEREDTITREKGAVFIMQIGDKLRSGERHDGRAPDYDDWSLNGDIMVWFETLNTALELSSMGIRVNEEVLRSQLKKAGHEERLKLPFHSMLAAGKLPQTAGGGIGQSRLCMFLLKKAHIGEVQASQWPDDMIKTCAANNIPLL